jgi:hypothetical protein
MITDPFYMPYGGINLPEEIWEELKIHPKVLKVVEIVKGFFDQDLSALITKEFLADLSFQGTINLELSACLIQFYSNYYISSCAIAMLSHAAFELDEEKVRFIKSKHQNEAYYGDNIVNVPDKDCRWGKNVLKSSLLKEIKEEPVQRSLFE